MKKFLTLILSTFILGSCSNDIIENYSPDDQTEKHNIEFLYKGIKYSSTYSYTPDSSIVYDNKEVESILNKIANLPESSTLIKEDGTIEFFDNRSTFPILLENETINDSTFTQTTRITYPNYSVLFYKDKNLRGAAYHEFFLRGYNLPIGTVCVQNNFTSTFDNEVSSIQTIGAPLESNGKNEEYRLVLYQYTNYSGKTLEFVISAGKTTNFNNLGNYNAGALFNTWNDKASSYKIYLSRRY